MPPRVEEVELVDPMVGPESSGRRSAAAVRCAALEKCSRERPHGGRTAAARRGESVGIARARARARARGTWPPFFYRARARRWPTWANPRSSGSG